MSILSQFSPDQEIYSIDESFLDLTQFTRRDLNAYGQQMRNRILQWTGLPVCVGIGSTKTLAKLANHCAKKQSQFNGVCNLNQLSSNDINQLLSKIAVGEVWGIGRKLAPKLNTLGINSVLDLKNADGERLRQLFSVVMQKTIQELNGKVCIEMEDVAPAKKQILSSRSFGVPVYDLASLSESVSLYVTRAAEKLRKQHSYAGALYIFIRTSPFKPNEPFYSNGLTVALPSPTDDTRTLVSVALWSLNRLYRAGYNYQKAGVMLSELVPAEGCQTDLFTNSASPIKSKKLMTVMDNINKKMGKESIKVASEGFKCPWKMKQENKSPSYTTNWDELLVTI